MKKLTIVLFVISLAHGALAATDQPSYGLFGQLHIARPAQAGGQAVLLLSDRDGWSARQDQIAAALAAEGAMVVGIDMAAITAVRC